MLKSCNRIKNKRLIAKLFKGGNVYKNRTFVFRFDSSFSTSSQFAIITSKKISKKAVERNHLRRQISHILRKHLNLFKKDIVALVLPRNYNKSVTFQKLEKEMINFIDHVGRKK